MSSEDSSQKANYFLNLSLIYIIEKSVVNASIMGSSASSEANAMLK